MRGSCRGSEGWVLAGTVDARIFRSRPRMLAMLLGLADDSRLLGGRRRSPRGTAPATRLTIPNRGVCSL